MFFFLRWKEPGIHGWPSSYVKGTFKRHRCVWGCAGEPFSPLHASVSRRAVYFACMRPRLCSVRRSLNELSCIIIEIHKMFTVGRSAALRRGFHNELCITARTVLWHALIIANHWNQVLKLIALPRRISTVYLKTITQKNRKAIFSTLWFIH